MIIIRFALDNHEISSAVLYGLMGWQNFVMIEIMYDLGLFIIAFAFGGLTGVWWTKKKIQENVSEIIDLTSLNGDDL